MLTLVVVPLLAVIIPLMFAGVIDEVVCCNVADYAVGDSVAAITAFAGVDGVWCGGAG